MSLRTIVLTATAALSLNASANASTFGLESSVGAMPTFSITSGGVTATYSSSTGNLFVVQNTSGLLTFNTALLDNNFFGTDPLTVSFSTPPSAMLIIPFAILDANNTTDSLTVTANTGQTTSFLATPDGLVLGEPEGIASFSPTAPISSVTLSSTNAFAIGDITATTTVTPEPSSIALLATGIAGFASRRWRRPQ